MCHVKELFFDADECVMQLHPPKSEYVNCHQYCLHLWRPQTAKDIAVIREQWGEEWCYGDLPSPGEIPRPESMLVGPLSFYWPACKPRIYVASLRLEDVSRDP
jgi:hypothetical protein